ncbi:MATE family efflux transporter [Vibrio splendidus]
MNTLKQATLETRQEKAWSFKPILAIAWPMILVALVVSISQNAQVWILGQDDSSQALYQLSMLQPFNFLFIALLECVTITNQVFSARSTHGWASRKVLNSTGIFAIAGTGILLVLAAISFVFEGFLQPILGGETEGLFQSTLPMYLLSLIPLLIFELCNAALRGQGKSAVSMGLISTYIILNVTVCYFMFTEYRLGFDAVIYANVISTLAVLPFSLIFLYRQVNKGEDTEPHLFMPRLLALVGDAGIPIFLSMLIAFASSVVVFPILSGLNADYAPGFLIVAKLRSLFIIPAVAVASAIAIYVNQQMETMPKPILAAILSKGFWILTMLYATLSLMVFFVQKPLVDVLASTDNIQQAGYLFMALLFPTYFLTSLVAASQTVLEQLGRGRHVLLLTMVCEGLMILCLLAVVKFEGQIQGITYTIIAFNVIYLSLFLRDYFALVKRMENEYVV